MKSIRKMENPSYVKIKQHATKQVLGQRKNIRQRMTNENKTKIWGMQQK